MARLEDTAAPSPTDEQLPAPAPRRHGPVRRALAWLLPVVLAAGLTGVALRIARPSEGDALDRYNPRGPGTTWVYDTRTNGEDTGRATVQVVETAIMLDGGSAQVISSSYENFTGLGPLATTRYEGTRGNRVLTFGNRIRAEYTEYDPPVPGLELPIRQGHRWTWRGAFGEREQRATFVLQGMEDVEAAGRTWSDCAHYVANFEFLDDGSSERDDSWICPGVGAVRSRAVFGDTTWEMELVGFRSARMSIGIDAVPVAASTDGSGGPGLDSGRTNFVPDGTLDLARLAWTETRTAIVLNAPVGDEDTFVFAEEDGLVTATDTTDGRVLWRVQVRGPVVGGLAMAGPIVLVPAGDKSLFALDAVTGGARWTLSLDDLASAVPTVAGDVAVVATEDRAVHGVRLSDGEPVWSVDTDAVVRAAPAVAGDVVVVGDADGGLTALRPTDGTVAWQVGLEGPLLAGPVVRDGVVYATDDENTVVALDAATGEERWNRILDSAVDLGPVVTEDTVVVVAAAVDRLVALDAADGTDAWRVPFDDRLDVPPVAVGDELLAISETGRVSLFDVTDGAPRGTRQLQSPDGTPVEVDGAPMALVGGNLVLHTEQNNPWPFTRFLAFPLDAEADAGGVRFAGAFRVIGGLTAPHGPPGFDGDDLVVPMQDGTVVEVPGTGGSRVVYRTENTLGGFAVPARDVVLIQEGTELVAVGRDDGDARWRFEVGSLASRTPPVVIGDTVAAPVAAQGLAGLDLETGDRRWFLEMPNAFGLSSSPLALDGGDVIHAAGRLSRVDGRTGEERWTVPGVISLGKPAISDGVVVVQGFEGQTGVVMGVDAADGRVLWTNPLPAVPLFLGPAAANGIAAVPDNDGFVYVLDLRTGEQLWTTKTRSGVSSSPVIVDGRVAVVEQGRSEDAAQRDYRLSVHDGETGRLLASFEVPGGSFGGSTGSFTSHEDQLVAPALTASEGGAAIMVVRMREGT